MIIILLLVIHWYSSLFFQTFFLHRYAAHQQFTMSKNWEKVFYISAWFSQGFTSLSPNTYGKFHRMHHAYADTKKDVHSPKHDKTFVAMMLKTDRLFRGIRQGKIKVEDRFNQNLPNWEFMEKYAYSLRMKFAWLCFYIAMYYFLVPENAKWMWALLPLHCLMVPLQGAIINWFAHLIGYTNYKVSDTSKNLVPFDLVMMGEGYHNNHHANPMSANFGKKWFEWDLAYPFIYLFNTMGIIEIPRKKGEQPKVATLSL